MRRAKPRPLRPPRSPRDRAARKHAEARGRRAETLCTWLLRAKGYRILARRFRTPAGELDIVARRGGTIAFVEVKARANLEAAILSITPHQQTRIMRAALLFVASRPGLAALNMRFDVMLAAPWRWPVHMPNAWTE